MLNPARTLHLSLFATSPTPYSHSHLPAQRSCSRLRAADERAPEDVAAFRPAADAILHDRGV